MSDTERTLKVSRRGVYYDLSISPYEFDNGVYRFVFSSRYNFERFKAYKKTPINLDDLVVSIPGMKGITVDISPIRDINEYQRIEKRGFSVYSYKTDKWYNKLEQMIFAVLEV